ncbi:MAG: hypothetical protein HYT40_03655 [Candidatus Sungbacteria bacterium]|uniref:Uncharacterized protein n=1 Tax=Candidatus Sungiibacteriota bacterium TaxID=2750080 RepID=A0A931WPX5_9BACT|nr:hypothetical protein [Candidatus Sungbacteria bacterium]
MLGNDNSFETVYVVCDPVPPFDSIEVARGKGSTAASMFAGDTLAILGQHQE